MPAHKTKRLATDGVTLDDEAVGEFVEFLESRLGADDFSKLKDMLARSQQSEDDETDEESAAMDEPPDFKGKPKTGGTMVASDVKGKSYADRFPEASRIKVGY